MPIKKPQLVGVTGGIGSGKSTVCRVFSTLGIPIYDADANAKKLMIHDKDLILSVKSSFGKKAYGTDGSLNRDYLAKTVFSDPIKLSKLNELVHPAVAKDFESWAFSQNTKYIIKEAALLIESGSYKKLDTLINVSTPTELRIKRIKQRDSFRTEEEIHKIINNQLSEQERKDKSDFVIKNDETELLISQILKLHQTFLNP